MIPQITTQSGTGTSNLVVFDLKRNPFAVGIGCVVTGNVTYTVQHTFDNVYSTSYSAASGTWFSHDNADLVNATTNQNDNYAFPVQASRVNVTAGTGSVTVTYIQAGLLGA